MSKKYLPLLIILFILWILFAFFFCKTCWLGKTTAAVAPPVKEAISGWMIKDGARFNSTCDTGFDFNRSALNHLTNSSSRFSDCMTETVNYLDNNPNRALTITGKYSNAESYNGIFSNLGLARANDVKSYMMGLGIAATQLNTTSRIIPDGTITNNTLNEGVDFGFGAVTNNSRLPDIKSRLIDTAPAVTIRFNTGSDAVNLTAQQQQDFADIVYYLDNVPSSNVEIGGHTDNVGGVALNTSLSQNRADGIKDYLVTNGIVGSRMSTQGYGPNNPLNNNATAQDKALNRRVEVVLKHN